ncbi:ArnT family glycosyltransferase [Acidicapsa dinghuensis]|uniref:ArnT family glycosyltransferase n=1 Tax=Acidicapsa dinghuensis TaxID=2218256 RepID=A0ABW1ELZ8_9BACT|nr:glycosyltransferase family 39 protein [Acidicapsa dinghuensis]
MLAILPVLVLIAVAAGFYRRSFGLRDSFLYATIPLGLFMVFMTESLSAFRAIDRLTFSICWFISFLAALFWSSRQHSTEPMLKRLHASWRTLNRVEQVMVCAVALVAALIALTAILSAPNTWDAMEYHMPRVVEWIGNRSVRPYPTIDRQQIAMPPFSEYWILHLQLLSASDRFANLVQWFSYIGSAIAASLIARELGGSRRAQVLAFVIAATIETGILAASGTKNDYALSYWIAVLVFLMLRWRHSQSRLLAFAMACALALAVFSKGTAYLFIPPLVVACFFVWNAQARKRFLFAVPLLIVVFAAVNGPLWARNYAFSGSVLGPPYFDGAGPNEHRLYANGHITPARSLANILRNVALNLSVPSEKINAVTTKVFSRAMLTLGVDPNDPEQLIFSQSGSLPPFDLQWRPASETQSANQGHFALMLLATILFLWRFRSFDKSLAIFAAGILCSFLLFAIMIRWSPWNARWQLPDFILGAAFAAIVFARALPRSTGVIAALLLLLAIPLSMLNNARPLVGYKYSVLRNPRNETYFFDHHREVADNFIQASIAARNNSCRSVGIDATQLRFEYPVMAIMNEDHQPRRFSYMAVQNSTTAFADPTAPPVCLVVCLGCIHAPDEAKPYVPQYNSVQTFGDIVVFSDPKSAAATHP